MLYGTLEMQFISMMWLSTTRGHQKVNKYKKSKLKFLKAWTKIFCRNCNIMYITQDIQANVTSNVFTQTVVEM